PHQVLRGPAASAASGTRTTGFSYPSRPLFRYPDDHMEDVLPPQTESGAGFEPTRIRQFTVFLQNKVGRLQQLVRAFEEHEGRIVALSIEESGDAALVRIICSDPDRGKDILDTNGFPYGETDILAVELPKRTKQPLIAICAAL